MMRPITLTSIGIGLLAAGAVYVGITWIPLIGMIPIYDAAYAFQSLLVPSLFDLSAPDQLYTLVLSILFGINTALLAVYVRLYATPLLHTRTSIGFVGIVVALLGLGCASCGTLLFTAVFSNILGSGIGALVTQAWPLRAFGIALMLFSMLQLGRALYSPRY